MQFSLSLKMLLRTPTKTVITFLLLAAAAFALFSRVGEYAVSSREFNRVAEGYMGVMAAEAQPPPEGYVYSHMDNPHYQTAERTLHYGEYFDHLRLEEIREMIEAGRWYGADEYTDDEEAQREVIEIWRYSSGYYYPLTAEQIKQLSELPYVERVSTRYMTAGVSVDGFMRADFESNRISPLNRYVFEGTLQIKKWDTEPGSNIYDQTTVFPDGTEHRTYMDNGHATLTFGEIKPLTGSIYDIRRENQEIFTTSQKAIDIEKEQGWGIRYPYQYLHEFYDTLIEGERYVISTIGEANKRVQGNRLGWVLNAPDDNMLRQWEQLYSLEGQPENYLELEEFADLRAFIDLINDDRHTFDMIYTDDMSSIIRFSEGEMDIIEGRALTPEDTENNAQICVVNEMFMRKNDLNIGDKITLRLGDMLLNQNAAIGTPSYIQERRPQNWTTVELEIVGVYDDMDSLRITHENPFWCYTKDTIFVPLSLLPPTADVQNFKIAPSEVSFLISDPRNISLFMEEAAPLVEEMGLTLRLSNGGWLELEKQFSLAQSLAVIAILSIAAAGMVAIGLTVYLFVGRKKRDYAVMRALGVTRRSADRSLFLPLLTVAVAAIIVGSAGALIYTEGLIAEALAPLIETGHDVNVSVPLTAILGCVSGMIALLCIFAMFGLWRIGRSSPLALLQGDAVRQKAPKQKKSKTPKPTGTVAKIIEFRLPSLDELPRKFNAARFITRYTLLRCRRTPLRTLLSVVLAAMFFGSIAQFCAMRYSYQDLFETFEVKGTFSQGISLRNALRVAESGYAKDMYLEHRFRYGVEIFKESEIEVYMTNDIQRFAGADVAVNLTFADGYDETVLFAKEAYCILGGGLMDELGIEIGDEIQIADTWLKNQTTFDGQPLSENRIRQRSAFYTVVGRADIANHHNDRVVFVTLYDAPLLPITGAWWSVDLNVAEFTLADNYRSADFREYGDRIVRASVGNSAFVINTAELDSIGASMNLFRALFPVITAVLILIGGLLPGLMILQSSKEAAIFRILGTTKYRARSILLYQQLMLCVLGISLGAVAVRFYNGGEMFWIIAATVMFCAALYFITCISATALSAANVTKRKVLDLLQVKE